MGCMSFFQTFIIAANSCSLFEFQKWEASMKIFCFLLRVSSRQNDWGLNPLFVRLFVFLCFRAAFYFSVSTIFFFFHYLFYPDLIRGSFVLLPAFAKLLIFCNLICFARGVTIERGII